MNEMSRHVASNVSCLYTVNLRVIELNCGRLEQISIIFHHPNVTVIVNLVMIIMTMIIAISKGLGLPSRDVTVVSLQYSVLFANPTVIL